MKVYDEKLTHVDSKGIIRAILIQKLMDGTVYHLHFRNRRTIVAVLNNAQYAEFRCWFNKQSIRYFDDIVDVIISNYRVIGPITSATHSTHVACPST
jgi:hypothetical protein